MASTRIELDDELFASSGSSSFTGTVDLPLLKVGPDLYSFSEELPWEVYVTNAGDGFLVNGTVEGDAVTSCVRCLEPFTCPLFGEIEGYYLFDDPGDNPPEDFAEDEYEVLSPDHVIDIMPLIMAALRMDVPMVPLCDDECKGICPTCGKNLNEGPCGCAPAQTPDIPENNPFAVLKNLNLEDNDEA